MAYNNFYDLDVWKEARRFKLIIYELVKDFPNAERFELTNQLIRSTRSIAANIAEGHGRQSVRDELHYCIMARGSWTETLNHLIDATDCGIISLERLGALKADWDKLGRVLNGYINFHRAQLSRKSEFGARDRDQLSEPDIPYTTQEIPDGDEDPDQLQFFRSIE